MISIFSHHSIFHFFRKVQIQMKLLIILEPISPAPGNNALAFSPLIPLLKEGNEVSIVSVQPMRKQSRKDDLVKEWFGCKVYYPVLSAFRSYYYSALAKLAPSYHGMAKTRIAVEHLVSRLDSRYHFDGVISTYNYYEQVDASLKVKSNKRILYIMDPMGALIEDDYPTIKKNYWRRVLSAQSAILTTPFIKKELERTGLAVNTPVISVSFPKVVNHIRPGKQTDDQHIYLLFSGWLYSDIRSPKYFLDILSLLDERFVVTFMGRECEKLTERFDIQTKAKLITLPQQPYDVAVQAMENADILINIGNSIPVHIPSKTLEYINTGKPIVNIYKMENCPTLYYTQRYPLCLNMSEMEADINAEAQRFIQFCVESKGRTVDRNYIETEFEDCTPQYIAKAIKNALES